MILAMIGLGLATIGSVIMAISSSILHKTYAQAFRDLQDFCNTLGSLSVVQQVEFSGLPDDVEKGRKGADVWNLIGIIVLGLGFIFQLVGMIVSF